MYLCGGYWPSWKYYEQVYPSAFDLSHMSHVTYAFASIDGDGTVYLADEHVHFTAEIDGVRGSLRAWTSKKLQHPNLKVILAVGGGSDGVHEQFVDVVSAGNEEKLARFVQSAADLVTTLDLDGLEIDWEHPADQEQGLQCVRLLQHLRHRLPRPLWLNIALPAGEWALQQLDLTALAAQVNYIDLMAYDFVAADYPHVTHTGHHAQLYSGPVKSVSQTVCGAHAVDYLLARGVPPSQILLGIPLYGRSFLGTGGFQDAFEGVGGGIDGVYEVKHLPKPGAVEQYDVTRVAAYTMAEGEFVTYDNAASVVRKAEYVKGKGLAGLFYWHMAADRIGHESLIKRGWEALNS